MGQINNRGGRSDYSGRSRSPNRTQLTSTTAIPGAQVNPADNQHDELLTSKKLAERWAKADKTLSNDRSLDRGCRYVKLGRHVRYHLSDVLAYEAEHTKLGNSEEEVSP
jgi:hypothetical protein